MTQTVIGIFDAIRDANRAREALVKNGFRRSDIEVHANNASYADRGIGDVSDPVPGTGVGTGTGPDMGVMARVEHFFNTLFGNDDRPEEVGHYYEAVRRGNALLSIDVQDDTRMAEIRDVLVNAGATDINQRVAQWQAKGYTGDEDGTPVYTHDKIAAQRKVLPVVHEEMEVGKRQVDLGSIRAYSRIIETPVSESVRLREEHATVERRMVNRAASAEDLKQAWVEIHETEERVVVGKTARVVEEVVIGKEATERVETVTGMVRRTEVEVERATGDAVPATEANARVL
jgi:uncharacterized protein (TIGR02271 family)